MSDRFIVPVPADELERRWAAAAKIMQEQGCDALVMQNSNDWLGGYVRWFTGAPANNAYPRSVIFFGPSDMTVVEQGPTGGVSRPKGDAPGMIGIREVRHTPSYTSAHFTAADDADLVADALAERGVKRVGWVNPAGAYFGFGKALERRIGEGAFVDVTDAIDLLKAVKSPYELGLVRQTAALQDKVIEAVRDFIRPGLRDFEVAAFAQYQSQLLGAEQGIFISSSAERGKAAVFRPRHMQGRTIEKGDTFALLVETNGPGGYYTEIARSFSLGKPADELVNAVQIAVDAQRASLDRLKPGTRVSDILVAHNAYMAERGLPEERRLYCHGQGYDMVERPLIREDDDMVLHENMNIVCHPGVITEHYNGLVCDNYIIGADGPGTSIHATPNDIIVI